MSGSTRVTVRALVAAFILCSLAGRVNAVDIGYRLGLAGQSSDNITRAPDDVKRSDWITRYQAALLLNADTPLVTSNTIIGGIYRDYARNIFDDRVDYLVDSQVALHILPQRLIFNFDDYFTRIQINTADPDTPNNQQDTNVMSLGPTINARLGAADLLVLEGRIRDTYYEAYDTDNRAYIASARLQHQQSAVSTTSIGHSLRYIRYDDPVNPTLLARRTTVGYSRAASRITRLSMEYGRTLIENRSQAVDDTTSTTAVINLTRRTSRFSTLTLDARQEVSDASQLLVQNARSRRGQLNILYPGTIFLITQYEAGLRRDTVYGNQAFTLRYREIDFEDIGNQVLAETTSDQNRSTASLTISYNMSGSMQAGLGAYYRKTEYLDTFRTDTDNRLEVWGQRQIRQRLGLRLSYFRRERDSTDPLAEYLENRATISIGYSYAPGQPPGRDPLDFDNIRNSEQRGTRQQRDPFDASAP